MSRPLATIAAVAFALTAFSADAAPCRDAHGKFIKCPPPAASTAPKHCVRGKPCGNTCIAKDKVCHLPK
jgi:hypothetical protein